MNMENFNSLTTWEMTHFYAPLSILISDIYFYDRGQNWTVCLGHQLIDTTLKYTKQMWLMELLKFFCDWSNVSRNCIG